MMQLLTTSDTFRCLLPREKDYRTPISKYPTAERLNDHDTVQLRDVQGTLNASGAFIDEYHLSQHASFDNQQGRFGFIAKGRLPVADVLHAALNPTKVVWEKKVVGPFDDGKLFLCHGDNCTICTTQALPGLGGEKYLVVKAGGRRERIS